MYPENNIVIGLPYPQQLQEKKRRQEIQFSLQARQRKLKIGMYASSYQAKIYYALLEKSLISPHSEAFDNRPTSRPLPVLVELRLYFL